MPSRRVSVSHVYVHEPRKLDKRKDVRDFDGEGSDLLALLRGLIVGMPEDKWVNRARERYLRTINLEPAGRSLLIEMEAGYYGTKGKVRNVSTHDLEHEHDENSATTRDVRIWATAPAGSPAMLVFVERIGSVAAGTDVLSLFHRAWMARWGEELKMKVETLVETQAWLDRAELEKVSGVVRAYDFSSDIADSGKSKSVGKLHTTLEPEGIQEFLPKKIWRGLRDGTIAASTLLGLPDDVDVDEVHVTVSADGKSKTFAIDKERQPAVSYVLSPTGAAVDDQQFKSFCKDLARDLYPKVGSEWKTEYGTGTWTSERLAATLSLPDPTDE